MADAAVQTGKVSRDRAQMFLWAGIGLALLAGSAGALYFSVRNDDLAAYDSAPACATFADAVAGKNCRYTTTVTIIAVGGTGDSVGVDFDVAGQYSPLFGAVLPVSDTSLQVGDEVQAEFWGSRVTRIGGTNTTANPASDARHGTALVIGLLLLPLALGAAAWAVVLVRRQIRGAQGQPGESPTLSPVAFSDVLWR